MQKRIDRSMFRGPRGLYAAWRWSWQGLRAAWQNEVSFRSEILIFCVAAPLGLLCGQTAVERVLLVGSLLAVLATELLNSAIETVVERFGNEHHALSGRAKDMGSAAVFVVLMNVVLCWGLILIPRLL